SGWRLTAGGVLGLSVLTPMAYFVISGITQKTYLFLKVRELVFGSQIKDWLVWSAAGGFILLVLWLLGLLGTWLAFCIAAVILAFGFHIVADAALARQRQSPIADAEQLFRGLRLQGLDEETLRQFVCKYSGKSWE